jgi:hypothetical protein
MQRTIGLIIMFYIISNITFGNNSTVPIEDCSDNVSSQSSINCTTPSIDLNSYPKFSEYTALMKQFATTYPELCQLITIGYSTEGRELLVLKISDNVTINEAEPEFLYTSSMHGDELTGYPLMLKLIEELLTKYNKDEEITKIVNSTQIFINPLANPDGAYGPINSRRADIIYQPQRENANNVDLNRNYPDDIKGLHPYSKTFEKETKAFMAFEAKHRFVLSANFHSGEEVTNYPWDNKPSSNPHPDHQYFEHICKNYATQTQNDSPNHYFEFDPDAHKHESKGVTHGASWYLVYGTRQDYMNYYRHTKEITIELSKDKFPKAKKLKNFWSYHRQALLNFIKEANNGLQGQVTDVQGNPIEAKITIKNHDNHNSWVTSNKDLGDYYRLLSQGMYQITYAAAGYKSVTKYVLIKHNEKTTENIVLSYENDAIAHLNSNQDLAVNLNNAVHTKWYNKTPKILTYSKQTTNIGSASYNYKGYYSNENDYIQFDSHSTIKLNEVTINTTSTGEIEIQILNKNNKVIDSKIIFIEEDGVQTIKLDFIIPKGNAYKLALKDASEGLQLFCNPSQGHFPYYNNAVTLTKSSKGKEFYPYFYNWKYETMTRTEHVIDINTIPYNNFTYIFNPKNQVMKDQDFNTKSIFQTKKTK